VDAVALTTSRLLIRRFRASDAAGLHSYLSRPDAVRFEPYPVQTAADCERLAAERAQSPAFWAVCLRDGELVGNLYLERCEPPAWHTWELGYVFHPDHWGRGYASEAAAGLVTACFTQWHAHRVEARCDPLNRASWRLLERIGMRREGHLHQNASFAHDEAGDPIWKDTYLYAVLSREWTPRELSGSCGALTT
jgi:RimJ/RimL family protein N-acetyltransferase